MRIKLATQEIFVFNYVAVICTITKGKEQIRLVWTVMINPPALPINDDDLAR